MKYFAGLICLACAVTFVPVVATAQDKSLCSQKRDSFDEINSSYEAHKDRKKLNELHKVAEDVEDVAASKYREMEYCQATGNKYCRDMAMIAYKYCVPRALDALLITAQAYVDSGSYEVPKKIYRDIITTYTGPVWQSYVKKAEFGLEDLKETESKRKAKSKK
jgi:thiaminase